MNAQVNYRSVHARRGKYMRAEPVAALYERKLVHHVGLWPELEEQMCCYVPGARAGSPDRLDALVWALFELFIDPAPWVSDDDDDDDYEKYRVRISDY